MPISKYEAFAKVVELGSLTLAADALSCTQSAVSHSISSLEKECGFSVLTRSRAGVRLTEEGARLLPAVRQILSGMEQFSQISASVRGLDYGSVRVGAFTSVAVHWLPGVIKRFQHDYPDVDLKLMNGDYHDVEQWLEEGSVDIGFVSMPIHLKCECIPLMTDRLFAILPTDHKYADYPKFPLSLCADEPFISLLESSDHDARRALAAAGVKPNIKYSTKDDYAIIAMVEQGLGISIMPELLLKGRHDNIRVSELVPEAKRTIGMAITRSGSAPPAVRRFADYVVNWVSRGESAEQNKPEDGQWKEK
ncbi:MAG: LysR family transcriptional regulator [Oscillospiraceae bacterium]|nr:LysR family transcriptional regulator [Oscillospiraceae bacterium]